MNSGLKRWEAVRIQADRVHCPEARRLEFLFNIHSKNGPIRGRREEEIFWLGQGYICDCCSDLLRFLHGCSCVSAFAQRA